MPTGIYIRSDEFRKKCRKRVPWNKGKKGCYSEKYIEKLKNAKLGKTTRPHTVDTKKKISIKLMGHEVSDETKRKLKNAHTGKILSAEHKKNIGKSGIGRIWKKESKIKLSDSIKKYIMNNGFPGMTRGRNEESLLNLQEKIDTCIIDRNFSVLLYKPDGYCHETNTVYEVYEKYHDKCVFEDLNRENNICKQLGCDFIIIYDNTH